MASSSLKMISVPKYLRDTIILSCVVLSFGLDTGTIGPVTTMPSFINTFGELSPTLHGVVVSSILLPGAISSLAAGILADRYGRVRLATTGSTIFGIGAAIECGAPTLGVYILGRILKGIGEGLFLSAIFVQFATTIGLAAGYFICYGSLRLGDSSVSWRLPLGICSALAFLFAGLCLLVPDSPRWLVARGQVDKARQVAMQLGLDQAEMEALLAQPNEDLARSTNQSFLASLKEMGKGFRESFAPPFRSRTLFGCFLLSCQQFSGVDGILYYAPTLFRQAGLSSTQATFLASGVSALVIFGTTIPATLLADRWGRRTSTVLGGAILSTLMFLIGSLYAANQVMADSGAGRWVVIVSIYLFAVTFSATWAIGMRAFLVESLPRQTRASASSLAQSANWMTNYVVALITPIMIAQSSYGAYFLFAACTFVCTVVSLIWMRETRGHTLEAIEQRYSESHSTSSALRMPKAFGLKRINRATTNIVQVAE